VVRCDKADWHDMEIEQGGVPVATKPWVVKQLKRLVWAGMERRMTAKLIRLIAEERAVYSAVIATKRAEPTLSSAIPPVVQRGPFAGLQYPARCAVGSSYWPKILGTYELELADVMDAACERAYTHILDIGAGEGYYAVGLATRITNARIYAYEGSQHGQMMLRRMADLNGVADRIDVRGWCDAESLRELGDVLPARRTLVICDAEGAEYDMLAPKQIPVLGGWDLVVELHHRGSIRAPRDWLRNRFSATHKVRFIDVVPRDPRSIPELALIASEDRIGVLFERTEQYGWAVLEARGDRQASSRSLGGRD